MIFVQRVAVYARRARPSPGTAVAAAGAGLGCSLVTRAEMERGKIEQYIGQNV